MSNRVTDNGLPSCVTEHPAMSAWWKLRPGSAPATRVDLLKGRARSAGRSAYRLVGVGPNGSPVVAKRCRRPKALVERVVYTEFLPDVPLPALRYFGCVEEPHGSFCWLFLEDVGGQRYPPLRDELRRSAGQWLGRLHAGAVRVTASSRLPDLGPVRWLEQLRSAGERILAGYDNPALTDGDREVLGGTLRLLQALESRWSRVERFCQPMPRTLVHGDFVPKNIAVRPDRSGLVLLPFDWGQAGWGPPALDLAQAPPGFLRFAANADLEAYCEVVQGHWPGADVATVREWARLGTLVRSVMAMNWEARSLGFEWVADLIARMQFYGDVLRASMQSLGLAPTAIAIEGLSGGCSV
jgi:hypothetical protein